MIDEEIFPIDEEDDDVVVTIEMDNGEEVTCEILTIFEVENKDFIALLPVDKNGNPNEENIVYLYEYFEDEEGYPSIDNITDNDLYNKVAAEFENLAADALSEEE